MGLPRRPGQIPRRIAHRREGTLRVDPLQGGLPPWGGAPSLVLGPLLRVLPGAEGPAQGGGGAEGPRDTSPLRLSTHSRDGVRRDETPVLQWQWVPRRLTLVRGSSPAKTGKDRWAHGRVGAQENRRKIRGARTTHNTPLQGCGAGRQAWGSDWVSRLFQPVARPRLRLGQTHLNQGRVPATTGL